MRAELRYIKINDDIRSPVHYRLLFGRRFVTFFPDYHLDDYCRDTCREQVFCVGNFIGRYFTVSLVVRKQNDSEYTRIGIAMRDHDDYDDYNNEVSVTVYSQRPCTYVLV